MIKVTIKDGKATITGIELLSKPQDTASGKMKHLISPVLWGDAIDGEVNGKPIKIMLQMCIKN